MGNGVLHELVVVVGVGGWGLRVEALSGEGYHGCGRRGPCVVVLQPLARRLGARLWPGLAPAARIELGRALPIP